MPLVRLLGFHHLLRLLVELSCSSSYLSFLLVPDVHPDDVVASLSGTNVLGEAKHFAGHLLPVLRFEVGPVLVLLERLLERGWHVPLLGLARLEADFPELGVSGFLGHDELKVAVKKVKFINDKLLR